MSRTMTDRDIRLTQPTLKVLRFLLEKPREGRSGAEMAKATKVGSGTLYPMLARLEAAGWLTSEWEAIDPREAGRPRRRFYKLTAIGQNKAHAALADLQMAMGELAWTS
jgi:PadR family transcriptional regulator PadR